MTELEFTVAGPSVVTPGLDHYKIKTNVTLTLITTNIKYKFEQACFSLLV